MPSEEHYDDSAFIYFSLSVLSVILIPSSFAYLKKWKQNYSTKYKGTCGCNACRQKALRLQIEARKPGAWGLFKFVIFVVLWVLFFVLLRASTQQKLTEDTKFDPYAILGLDFGADDAEIKKAYRKLTLIWHPDKNKQPGAEETFIKIRKAHETLTDPEKRAVWEKYGNPDGPQSFSVGIALPSFLVESKNSLFVLALYVVFLVLVFPTIAICFWQKQKSTAYNQLLAKTMELYWVCVKENVRFRKLVDLLSLSFEYKKAIPLRATDEKELKDLSKFLVVEPDEKAKSSKKKIPSPWLIKHKMLFFAHFSRLHDKISPNQSQDLQLLLSQSIPLVSGLGESGWRKGMLIPTYESVTLTQMLVQAIWGEYSRVGINTTFLQLPHLKEDHIKKLNSKKWRLNNNILAFCKLTPEQRNEILDDLTSTQLADVEAICKEMPHDVQMDVRCEVEDDEGTEKEITGGSVVTLVATFQRDKSKAPSDNKSEDMIEVHAPFFPIKKNEMWWLILGDERTNKLLCLPKKITCLRDGHEEKLKFQVPLKAGLYHLTTFLLCDSYAGFDHKKPFSLRVEKEILQADMPPPESDEESSEGEHNAEVEDAFDSSEED